MGRFTEKLKSYLSLIRWDKPTGTWLLFWPCSWGVVLGGYYHGLALWPMLELLAWFFLGAVAMRSAGCIINDIWDKEFDAQVARTQYRPLASGALKVSQALGLLLVLLLIALLVVMQLPWAVFGLAVFSLPLVIAYPLMKRFTHWPQAFLGLTFNFGALMGWAAVSESVSLPLSAWLLYAGGFFWTLGYDTIYAFQDIEDDKCAGIKSTAIRLQAHAKSSVSVFYGLSFTCLCIATMMADEGDFWLVGAVLGNFSLHIALLFLWAKSHYSILNQQFKLSSLIGMCWLLTFLLLHV